MAVSPHDATLISGNIKHHISGRNRVIVSASPPGIEWNCGHGAHVVRTGTRICP
jgi:hypothetical protein